VASFGGSLSGYLAVYGLELLMLLVTLVLLPPLLRRRPARRAAPVNPGRSSEPQG
jgi:hypothetical protein